MKKFIPLIHLFAQFTLAAEGSVIYTKIYKNSPESLNAPSIYCLVDEKKKFKGFSHRMEMKNLHFDSVSEIDKSSVYRIQGEWKKDLTSKITPIGNCEDRPTMEQLRSDWLAEENKYSDGSIISWNTGGTTGDRLKELSYFHVSKIERVNHFQCRKTKDSLELKIPKLKDFDSTSIEVISHYEGGPGKPHPKYVKKIIQLNKKSNSVKIPLSISESTKGNSIHFEFHDLRIKATRDLKSMDIKFGIYNCK